MGPREKQRGPKKTEEQRDTALGNARGSEEAGSHRVECDEEERGVY